MYKAVDNSVETARRVAADEQRTGSFDCFHNELMSIRNTQEKVEKSRANLAKRL